MALPVAGMRCRWKQAEGSDEEIAKKITTIAKKSHVVGGCVQCFSHGRLSDVYTMGNAVVGKEKIPVTTDTYFRTASIAKMVTALLVFRLQTMGLLDVREPIEQFLQYRVRNPSYPEAPITLGMLLSHTSGIIDFPMYHESMTRPIALTELLSQKEAYANDIPGVEFHYSNLAAGMIGCLLEKRFGISFEALVQRQLFAPLKVQATFDASTLGGMRVADSYRVFPSVRTIHMPQRIEAAEPMLAPDPEHHFLFASGNLYINIRSLATLAVLAFEGGGGFLNEKAMEDMHHPIGRWPDQGVNMRHCMGLLQLDDQKVCKTVLWGHQGFAYGAVNGVFFDALGNGFVMLNNGASEKRMGHLATINHDLISYLFGQ